MTQLSFLILMLHPTALDLAEEPTSTETEE